MKQLFLLVALIIVFAYASVPFASADLDASAKASIEKLINSVQISDKGDVSIKIVLTKEEEKLLTNLMIIRKIEEDGVRMTPSQAAIFLGQAAGISAAMKRVEPELKKLVARIPSLELQKKFTSKTGISVYDVPNIILSFDANSESVERELGQKNFCAIGRFITIVSEIYYGDPLNRKDSQGEKPCVILGEFKAFLENDPVDVPAILPYGGISLLCEQFSKGVYGKGVQAKCRVAVAGPIDDDGHITPEYKNQQVLDEIGGEQ